MGDEHTEAPSFILDSGSVLVFEKNGAFVRVGESGVVDEDIEDEALRSEVQGIFDTQNHWVGIHLPLSEAGFRWVGVELFEDLALELLDDAWIEATEASRHLRRADDTTEEHRLGHRLASFPHTRKAIVLSAASAEAYINEFIARNLPNRERALDRIPPPARWSVAVELATGLRLEEELGELAPLRDLFALRNKLMHFHPSMRMVYFESAQLARGGIAWAIQQESDPHRFPQVVTDAILALNRITNTEDVDRVEEIVHRAIDKRLMDAAQETAAQVGAVIQSMTEGERAELKQAVRRWQRSAQQETDEG